MNAFIAESSKSQRQVATVTQVVSEEAHALHTPLTAVSARFVSSTKSIGRLNLANLVSSVSIVVAVRLQVCLRYAVNS